MKIKAEKSVCAVVAACCVFSNAEAYVYKGQLAPQNFNKMYAYAAAGRGDVLYEAVSRGLNIDTVNAEGDTGLCVAVKRHNYTAYNAFRQAGAHPRHACTYRMYEQYEAFLRSHQAMPVVYSASAKTAGSYVSGEHRWWPWVLGAAVVGGGIWALSSGGGGHHKKSSTSVANPSSPSSPAEGGNTQPQPVVDSGSGLAGYIKNYSRLISSGKVENTATIESSNSNAEKVVDSIQFLPNMLDNYSYLRAYAKTTRGGSFHNARGGRLSLGDAGVGLAAHGVGSLVANDGNISIEAKNGTIGMVASNGAQAFNAADVGVGSSSSDDGIIRFIFKGNREGDALVGMYGDTHSTIANYGRIIGSTSMAEVSDEDGGSGISGLISDVTEGTELFEMPSNSGTLLGMSLFDFYNGTDLSSNTVKAQNYGEITLQAGNNNASSAAISLIGMGSYLDDNFLNGKNNPALAEKMVLENFGQIDLSYQKTYNIASDALKLGNGGVIGMRADAATSAANQGTIKIDMQATTIVTGNDVATGMLSVHGAELVNGSAQTIYNGSNTSTGGTIRMVNEATSGGVFYGMLAAKGSGAQTGLYKWQLPQLHNYGLIDMQVSNSFAMASFAGGSVINDGVINLGSENGQSYYTNNKGLYADGADTTEEVSLVNNGIINIHSEKSSAIYNAFSGSVTQTNTGTIYLSNKATQSKVFGGNYSTAINSGDVWYKVGNSDTFVLPSGYARDVGINVQNDPVASAIISSSADGVSKQYVVNESNGTITLGGVRDKNTDYGGTFGTAAIQVSKQGSADNKGAIILKGYDHDISQYNVAMWLDSTATAEAYAHNYGTITIDANNAVGIRNDGSNASVTNFNKIYVNGANSYGMASTLAGNNIFNGRYVGDTAGAKTIALQGDGSVAMYARNGNVYNYGKILLKADNATAFLLDGAQASISAVGSIQHDAGLKGATYFWVANGNELKLTAPHVVGAKDAHQVELDNTEDVVIEGYTLGQATDGGKISFSGDLSAQVSGTESRLFKLKGAASTGSNGGKVAVDNKAIGVMVEDGALFTQLNGAEINVKNDGHAAIYSTAGKVMATAGSAITVDSPKGYGIYAKDISTVNNRGTIDVTQGTAMYLSGSTVNDFTEGTNASDGVIRVKGKENIGVEVRHGARFNNAGIISVSGSNINGEAPAYAIYSDAEVINQPSGRIDVYDNSYGIYTTNGNVTNNGTINVMSNSAYGIYNTSELNAVQNGGNVVVKSGTGLYGMVKNTGTVDVHNDSIGVRSENYEFSNSGSINVYGGQGVVGGINNSGDINVYSGTGIKGKGQNRGKIVNNGFAGVHVTGEFFNTSAGTISGTGYGAYVDRNGRFTNSGVIDMDSGTGIYVTNGGQGINTGKINMNMGTGMYVTSGGYGKNLGTILIAKNGTGAYVEHGGTFVNSGSIQYYQSQGGTCGNVGGTCENLDTKIESAAAKGPFYLESDAKLINQGVVELKGVDIDFDSGGEYVLADGGVYKATSFKGNVTAQADMVQQGFADSYVQTAAFEGENRGLQIRSESYMFEAEAVDNGDATDIKLLRKDFRDLVYEQDVADFLEVNYQAAQNEKMYQALKSATDADEFESQIQSETGKKFYANLPRENMAVLRGLNQQQQQRILVDGLEGSFADVSYFKTGKDGVAGLSDFEDNVYGVSVGGGAALSRYWHIGGSVTGAYVDSDYDDIHSSRQNKVLMAFLPIMYQNNRFKFLATPELGIGYGSYKRRTLANDYKADTFDIYYGVYNHAEYSVDVKVAELVAEAELNLQGMKMTTDHEKSGLKLHDVDATSLEGGIGVKIRKRIQLAKERELILALGTKYYHEFLDPYQNLTLGTRGTAAKYRLKGYDEGNDRFRTSAEAAYRDGPFTLSAEVVHNAEKESNVEGAVNLRYNFR
ncbi:MAG: hypothetical protein IJ864_03645 [Alphaproteobacteria bacterium]|nr:hypothetical protein [Alphaproteobacteria bacterium]